MSEATYILLYETVFVYMHKHAQTWMIFIQLKKFPSLKVSLLLGYSGLTKQNKTWIDST